MFGEEYLSNEWSFPLCHYPPLPLPRGHVYKFKSACDKRINIDADEAKTWNTVTRRDRRPTENFARVTSIPIWPTLRRTGAISDDYFSSKVLAAWRFNPEERNQVITTQSRKQSRWELSLLLPRAHSPRQISKSQITKNVINQNYPILILISLYMQTTIKNLWWI